MEPLEKISLEKIVAFLSSITIFAQYDQEILQAIAAELKVIYILSGEILVRQNDLADSFYIVMQGRLRAVCRDEKKLENIMGEIGAGEFVGETALLTEGPRTATVYAVRDSILLQFNKKTFDDLLQRYPAVIMAIAKFTLKRLVNKALPKNTVVTIAVIPAAHNPLLTEFTMNLVKELECLGGTLYLNSKSFKELYAEKYSDNSFDHERVISWLNQQETKFRYIVYEADANMTDWTRRCIRQADRILLVGLEKENCNFNEIEAEFFTDKYLHFRLLTEFVLTHQTSNVSATRRWLNLRPLSNYHHLRLNHQPDFAKLVRFITGRANGLVFSSGGARTLAYIGVMQALEELNIPIDIIAGCSMGAWIGASFALGRNAQAVTKHMETALAYYNKKMDYTLPLISVLRGRVFDYVLKESLGENTRIEDLWGRFFCISTNLSKGTLQIHDRGLLWQSVRASSSLPAIFPPIVNERNELLVDGAVINNLPVDVMRKYINSGNIIACTVGKPKEEECDHSQDLTSGWHLLFERFNPFAQKPNFPHIGKIIASSINLGSHMHEQETLAQANLNIEINMHRFALFDFKYYRQMIDEGYRAAMKILSTSRLLGG